MKPRPESIALFGGPKDGELVEVDAAPPLEYRILITPGPSSVFLPPLASIPPGMRCGIYTPRCDKLGVVERNYAGHPIYEWRGEQQ